MRNPKWSRDEIILALDLYFELKPGEIHARNPRIIELSQTLNQLPIHLDRSDEDRFRNPNGVGLKLSNFLAIDPNYAGKGMSSYSKADEELFNEFINDRPLLKGLAKSIKSLVTNKSFELRQIDDEEISVKEGKTLFKYHKFVERNSKIVRKKKEKVRTETGRLACELCGFDFEEFYGDIGKGFIECHHKKPLAELVESLTTLDDLQLLCANCHRMEHRRIG